MPFCSKILITVLSLYSCSTITFKALIFCSSISSTGLNRPELFFDRSVIWSPSESCNISPKDIFTVLRLESLLQKFFVYHLWRRCSRISKKLFAYINRLYFLSMTEWYPFTMYGKIRINFHFLSNEFGDLFRILEWLVLMHTRLGHR